MNRSESQFIAQLQLSRSDRSEFRAQSCQTAIEKKVLLSKVRLPTSDERSSDRAPKRVSNLAPRSRATNRATQRSSNRATGRWSYRATERSNDGGTARPNDRATDRSSHRPTATHGDCATGDRGISDRAIERLNQERPSAHAIE